MGFLGTLNFTTFCHIYHMPSPQQILYLRTASIFSHPTDPLLIRTALSSVLLSTRRALVMQMQHLQTQSCQTGEAASYQAVPESTAPRSICLASGDLKEALHCYLSSPVPLDAVSPQDPKLPGSRLLILILPKGGCLCPTAQTLLSAIFFSPALLGHLFKHLHSK